MIRTGSTVSLLAMNEFGRSQTYIEIVRDLPDVGNAGAGFPVWQVVLGEGPDKTVLWAKASASKQQ